MSRCWNPKNSIAGTVERTTGMQKHKQKTEQSISTKNELLPAIGKFIIVARDASDTSERLEEEAIEQVATLIECLVIVCRHFDNILAIITYEYKPNLIAILSKAFKQQMEQPHAVPAISHLFRSFSAFLEVMYDPYLTWRSFVRGQAADYTRLSYKPHSVHVEIVPFIYDCFQEEALVRHPDVGESLLNILGARNGMKAICPATVSITMGILRQWESGNSLRRVALNCYALMVIVLQKSSPEERQIDLVTLVQLYCDALQELLATKHFESGDINFDIASEEDQDVVIDMAALSDTVAAVKLFLTGGEDISESIGETNLLELLTNLPKIIMPWHIAHSSSLCSTMEALATLTRHSLPSANQLRQGERIEKLFASLREFSIGPSVALLETCFLLGYDESKHLLLMPEVMLQLLHWLPTLQEREQLHVTNMVLKGCTDNYGTKSVACDSRVIKAVCGCLLQSDSLAENCVQNLIKLIEELSKISIVPGELKCIFTLLRQGTKFPQSRQLQQTLVLIALQSLRSSNSCAQYFAIEQPSDGIVVPDIRNWTISGSYGFIFHILESGSSGYKSMLPSLLERTLSANVSNYFTLPTMRTQTAFDPNVKNFPIGMQDTVFGEPTCLQGHLGGVLLADPTTSLRTIFDAGMNFSSIFSQDNDLLELNSRFVFCYAPAAVWHGTCQDLIPGGKYPGRISAQHCKIVKIQETINSIGGISAILPILHRLVSSDQTADISIATSEEESLSSPTPSAEELGTDWEMLSSNSYTEWKMIQHPLASFLCLLRYLTHEHETNQEQLLASECLAIIGTMLQRCPPALFDVNALMATHPANGSRCMGHKSGTDARWPPPGHPLRAHCLRLWASGRVCRFQMTLGPCPTANLIYNFFVDKSYTNEIQEAAIRFISGLLATSRVHQKYKQVLRLYDQSSEQSMFPGFFSFITPMSLSSTILFHLADEMLGLQPDYAGLIFLVYHVSSCDLPVKLEIAKRLLQTTFVKPNATVAMARQTGWQESIARLLIRKPLTSSAPDEEKRRSFGINMDVLLEDNSSFLAQADLITFSEQEIGLAQLQSQQQQQEEQSDSGLILNEIQASVSEAATVIESEIKELAESVSGAVVDNVNSVFSVIRQTTHDLQDTFESLTQGSSTDAMDGSQTPSIQREESLSSDSSTPSPHGPPKKSDSLESTSAFDFVADGDVDTEEQLVYLVSNTLFNIFWRGIANDHPQCWQERGQVLGCINLLALNNELITSHLSLRLRILEMAVQASLFDLSEHGSQTLINQENASHILRMVYELVVLGSNEDESKKCSTKLLDGVLALLDALMIFQQGSSDDWSDMIRLCLGLLLKCSHHPNPGIVAMATAKLHAILQSRSTEDPAELSYLLYSINRALDNAIEVGNPEEYSFLMPVMKALLEKCRLAFNLDSTLPDLPSTSSGPVFFNDFQMYSTSKKWRNFIERMSL
ncbi:GL12834 [Drosophila persimilis]|uniref:GL12834 n=1 Tax=Drosophila persimilis TaxID=7234 RepID=B4H7W5_DROPE|nr:GL12834 [Drosophila persimilis]